MEHSVEVRVRYKETDAMGIVHHSNYVNYYELARTEFLRGRGITYREVEERGIMMPVLQVGMDFHAPARYDDLLTVKTFLDEMPAAKMRFRHEIYNQHGMLLNSGFVVLAFVNSATRRPCRIPAWFAGVL